MPDWWCYPERCQNGHGLRAWPDNGVLVAVRLCPAVAASGGGARGIWRCTARRRRAAGRYGTGHIMHPEARLGVTVARLYPARWCMGFRRSSGYGVACYVLISPGLRDFRRCEFECRNIDPLNRCDSASQVSLTFACEDIPVVDELGCWESHLKSEFSCVGASPLLHAPDRVVVIWVARAEANERVGRAAVRWALILPYVQPYLWSTYHLAIFLELPPLVRCIRDNDALPILEIPHGDPSLPPRCSFS
jgi:hypothetical protein